MKTHLLRQLLVSSTLKISHILFLVWFPLVQAAADSQNLVVASPTTGALEKKSFRITTRLTAKSPLAVNSDSDTKAVEITATPEKVEVISTSSPSHLREKEKKTDQSEGFPGLAGFPLSPERPSFDSYGGGYLGQDDDDSFKHPPYFPAREKGDFTLTLLPVLRIPSDWSSYLPGNQWYHWIIGEPDYDSGVTLHISFNGSSASVMQLSQAEYRQLKVHLGNSQQLLQWLAPKLSGREAFIHTLLDIASGLSEQDESTQQQLEKQIDTLAEWSDHELSLEFEWEQLGRILINRYPADMVDNPSPDTETVYEEDEVERLIQQMPQNWKWWERKTFQQNPEESGGSQSAANSSPSGQGYRGASGQGQDGVYKGAYSQPSKPQGRKVPSIVFFGKVSTGKSSIANRLIGYDHFPHMRGETRAELRGEEQEYKTPVLRVRSFPGYNGASISRAVRNDFVSGNVNTEYKIDSSDIVVYVLNKIVDVYDLDYIHDIINAGARIVFVHNKYYTEFVGYLNDKGCNIGDISEVIDPEKKDELRIKSEYVEFFREFKTSAEQDLNQRLREVAQLPNYQPVQVFMECNDKRCTEGYMDFIHSISTVIHSDEKYNWDEFNETRLAWNTKPSLSFIERLKDYILRTSGSVDPSLDDLRLWLATYVTSNISSIPLEEAQRLLREDNQVLEIVCHFLRSLESEESRASLVNIKATKLKEATDNLVSGLKVGGYLSLGYWGVLTAALLASPADELAAMGLAAAVGGAAVSSAIFTAITLGIPMLIGAGGYSIYRWWNHGRWAKEELIVKKFSYVALTIELYLAKFRQRVFDQIWADTGQKPLIKDGRIAVTDDQVVYEEIPPLGSPSELPPNLPPAKPPHILQDYYCAMTERDEEINKQLSVISFTGQTREAAQCSNWMKKNFPNIRIRLKHLWTYQFGQQGSEVKTATLHENGYYNSVIFIPLLYAYGVPLERLKQCNSDERILNLMTEHGFSPIREAIVQQKVPAAIKDEILLNTIELAVLIRDSPERTPIFLEGVSSLEIPELIFQLLAKPMDRPRQYSELMKVTATLLHKPEQIQIDQPLLEAMTVGKNAELLHDTHNTESQSVQITQPAHGVSAALLRLAANAADWVFSMGKWMDKVTYESLPAEDPKRTRIHRIGFLAEPLYGIHLRTLNLFNEYIGDITEPVIVAVNGYGDTNVWHAFLLFRNSKNGEFNTLHIRQGSYYPEFMDKEATLTYLREQKKILKDAFSVRALSTLYGSEPDLGRLRQVYSELCRELWIYKMKDNNCMTFSMLALDATPLQREELLTRASPQGVHSPYHIMKAIRESREQDHSTAMYAPMTNNLGLPDWLVNSPQL